jgi:hypothetical protein
MSVITARVTWKEDGVVDSMVAYFRLSMGMIRERERYERDEDKLLTHVKRMPDVWKGDF